MSEERKLLVPELIESPVLPTETPVSHQTQMPEAPGENARLSEAVYESLLKMILDGQMQPGQPVSELELSRTLRVSRTPVHEAIGQLVKDGLVIQARKRRPVVAEFTSADIFDVFEMRRLLESEAAYKAAPRIDRMTLTRLEEMGELYLVEHDKANALAVWIRYDDEFHAAIAAASGSRRLQEDVLRYRRLHRVFNRTHTDVSILAQALQEHLVILQALKQRDAEAARAAMQTHIQEWQRFFVQHLSS